MGTEKEINKLMQNEKKIIYEVKKLLPWKVADKTWTMGEGMGCGRWN